MSKPRILVCVILTTSLTLGAAQLGLIYLRRVADRAILQTRFERWQRTKESVLEGQSTISLSDEDLPLLEMLVDDVHCADNITSIWFFEASLGNSRFRRLSEFPRLREIGFYGCVEMEGLLGPPPLNVVESLSFESSHLSEQVLESMTLLPRLKRVHIEETLSTDMQTWFSQRIPHVALLNSTWEMDAIVDASKKSTEREEVPARN